MSQEPECLDLGPSSTKEDQVSVENSFRRYREEVCETCEWRYRCDFYTPDDEEDLEDQDFSDKLDEDYFDDLPQVVGNSELEGYDPERAFERETEHRDGLED